MATVANTSIEELNRQSARLEAEARQLRAQASKLCAEQALASAKTPMWWFFAKILLGAIALMGLGALPVILLHA